MSKFQFVHNLQPSGSILNKEIMGKIQQRRLQILVHSVIYYKLNTSLIEDIQFDTWAHELRGLQKKYPKESEATRYYEYFKNWDGNTGYDLPIYPFLDKAEQLIRYKYELEKEDDT